MLPAIASKRAHLRAATLQKGGLGNMGEARWKGLPALAIAPEGLWWLLQAGPASTEPKIKGSGKWVPSKKPGATLDQRIPQPPTNLAPALKTSS